MTAATRIVRRSAAPVPGDLPPDLHPVLARVYGARRIGSVHDLDRSLSGLARYDGLLGLDAAVDHLARVVEAGETILVVGDFDADGATGCAVAVRGLRALGGRADYLVPNRFEYGYGLTPEIVAVAARREPGLLLTVDNGISSVAGVDAANRLGIPVVITDHHLAGERLPSAAAIVNPNQPGDAFPSKSLAGVGVVFYVLGALRARLREDGWFARRGIEEPNLAALLDLVALGTVADVVPLDRNNRILVSQGLARIRRGHCQPGVWALAEVAGRDPTRFVASDLGFALAPRLNAAGRLEDMSLGIECLLCDDRGAAREMARRLDELNRERRRIEAEMHEQALALVERLDLEADDGLPAGLCLYEPEWHQGVIGILASRIKDRVNRPVVVFAADGDGALKGSARSVPGVHVRDVLDAVATREPGLLSRFGGHAMAAGLSLDADELPRFEAAFAREVAARAEGAPGAATVLSDGPLRAHEIGLPLARALRDGGPWGQGFPEPVFDNEFSVHRRRVVGERHLKMLLRVEGGDDVVEAIAFNAAARGVAPSGARIRAAYRLDVNEYMGIERAQLVVEHLEHLAEAG